MIENVKLSDLRYAANMTQTELAELTNVSQSTISELEHKAPINCRMSTLRKFVAALGGELRIQVIIGNTIYQLDLGNKES